ncbi:MAG: helix-turn-helix transcriptional regulator [Aquaticitalea sp.]
MIEINILANTAEDALSQMQAQLGGMVTEKYGEFVLEFDSHVGQGTVKCLTFDWGVSLMEFDAIFHKELVFIDNNSNYNPIHFSYVSKGQFQHRFCNAEEFTIIEQYHAAIIVGSANLKHMTIIPKGRHIVLNNIRVIRQEYRKKRLNNVEQLNERLYKVFVDDNNLDTFTFYSPINLTMDCHVNEIRSTIAEGMSRILHIEGEVYQLLSMHIALQDKHDNNDMIPHNLLQVELKMIKNLSEQIIKIPENNYSLEQLSNLSGLSQSKLQEGFKFIYKRTVTEYIRHIRLEHACVLMETTNLNISQIVYTIGFTSRSYFSKIFREKYGVTPHEFRKQSIDITGDAN